MKGIHIKIFFDIEASSLKLWATVWCMSFAQDNEAPSTVFGREAARDFMASWLVREECEIIGHNIITYDLPLLFHGQHFPRVRGTITDTLLLSKVMYPYKFRHGLGPWGDELAKKGLAPKKVPIPEDTWVDGNLPLMQSRCETDVEITRALYHQLHHRRNTQWLKMEQRWAPYMAEACSMGVPFLVGKGLSLATTMQEQIDRRIIKSPMSQAGYNIASSQSWDRYLKKHHNYELPLNPPTAKAIKKARLAQELRDKTTIKISLEKQKDIPPQQNVQMSKDNRLELESHVSEIADHFEHKKDTLLKGFFMTGAHARTKANNIWAKLGRNPLTGMLHIHSNYSYYGTRTLRSSYKEPCLNQFPKGPVRRAVGVLPGQGRQLLGIDVQQLELAWLGYLLKKLCNDDAVWQEKEQGLSPKKLTLEAYEGLFYKVPEEEREDRAKTINYAGIYGQRPPGACATLQLPQTAAMHRAVAEAQEKRFPSLDKLVSILDRKVSHNGIMLNAYGQPVKAMKGVGPDQYPTALNTMMQSSGMAYTKVMFYQIMKRVKEIDPHACIIISNHDEIQVLIREEVTKGEVQRCIEVASAAFEREEFGGVPLITGVDFALGYTWDETH